MMVKDETWECRYCWKTQNQEGKAANIMGNLCPTCFWTDNYYEEDDEF